MEKSGGLTAATSDGHRLYAVCVQKDTGRIVHDLLLLEVENPTRITAENTSATPTPVIGEGRVFIIRTGNHLYGVEQPSA